MGTLRISEHHRRRMHLVMINIDHQYFVCFNHVFLNTKLCFLCAGTLDGVFRSFISLSLSKTECEQLTFALFMTRISGCCSYIHEQFAGDPNN